MLIKSNINLSGCQINPVRCWCQELVGTFLTSKKLFAFNLGWERLIPEYCVRFREGREGNGRGGSLLSSAPDGT